METWILRYDEDGVCRSPKTRDKLIDEISTNGDRPLILFSHGWNNDFADATSLYKSFLTEFEKITTQYKLTGPAPIFVGLTWPSVWLASDEGPQMASSDDRQDSSQWDNAVEQIASKIEAMEERSKFYGLMQEAKLSPEAARRLARVLLPSLRPAIAQEEGARSSAENEEDSVLRSLYDLQRVGNGAAATTTDDLDDIGVVGDRIDRDPAAASFTDYLDPRNAIRLASLYLMKDRAGRVGSTGAASLLMKLLANSRAQLHLVGHSFGCKVLLSALAALRDPKRKIASTLLLQPAVSHLCFADTVPGRSGAGGYRDVVERIERPIMMTYSNNDFPLHSVYHLALLREKDLGELKVAGGTDTTAGAPPNSFAALGGFGPRASHLELIDPIPGPGEAIKCAPGTRLVGLDGSANKRIDGHGGVANPYTAWALRTQMADGIA